MKRSMFALAAALLFSGVAQAADFALGFSACPTGYKDAPGTAITIPVEVTLTSTNIPEVTPGVKPDGAQGWSWSLKVTGGTVDPASFVAINPEADPPDIYGLSMQISTMYDNDANAATPDRDPNMLYLYKAGFLVFEPAYVTQKPDRPAEEQPVGAVCAIVLHQTKKMVLQPTGTQVIGKFNVQTQIPATGDGEVTLAFENGLFGSGEAVANVITFNSTSNTPTATTCTIPLRAPGQEFQLGLVAAGSTDMGGEADGDNIIAVDADPGVAGTVSVDVLLKTAGLPAGDGPQGWSVGIQHDPALAVATTTYTDIEGTETSGPNIAPPIPGITKVNTLYDNDANPATADIEKAQDLAAAGFMVSELAFVTAKASRPAEELPVGVVSAIVLHQTKKMVLKANATDKILRLALTLPAVAEGATQEYHIGIADDLFGSGEAVKNVITYQSASKQTTVRRGALIRVTGISRPKADQFIRGDANNDGKVDIADAVWIVYTVVPGIAPGYAIPCTDAGDTNDDEALNLADAVYVITYSFQGGAAPAAPFTGGCGSDDDSTETTCPDGTTDCPPKA